MPQFDFSDDEALSLSLPQGADRRTARQEVSWPGRTRSSRPSTAGSSSSSERLPQLPRGVEGRAARPPTCFTTTTRASRLPSSPAKDGGAAALAVRLPQGPGSPAPLAGSPACRPSISSDADADRTWCITSRRRQTSRTRPHRGDARALRRAGEGSHRVDGELKCLSCHVVGKLGPNQDPASAAPNFQLAKSRLSPDWIVAWLPEPEPPLQEAPGCRASGLPRSGASDDELQVVRGRCQGADRGVRDCSCTSASRATRAGAPHGRSWSAREVEQPRGRMGGAAA